MALSLFMMQNVRKESVYSASEEADAQLYEDMTRYGRRNIACLTIAPTGTTSLMTQTTSGIEPVFMPVISAVVR